MNGIQPIQVQQLAELDIDLQAELNSMTEGLQKPLPRIRVEHSPSGKHRMLIDYGPTLEEDSRQEEVPDNTFTGVVLLAQQVRAVFEADSPSPTCASVNDQPTVDTPRSASCGSCSWSAYGSPCKEKTRLLLLDPDRENPTPVSVFPLSPTSIKHWKRYLQRLAASKVPYLVMMTRFTLQDIQRNGFRWAEVVPVAERLVTPAELEFIKEVRAEYNRLLADVRRDDYSDPGDATDEG